jgi:hypothetical protein
MGEMKVEHVLLFLVGAFLVYHMMKGCGRVEGWRSETGSPGNTHCRIKPSYVYSLGDPASMPQDVADDLISKRDTCDNVNRIYQDEQQTPRITCIQTPECEVHSGRGYNWNKYNIHGRTGPSETLDCSTCPEDSRCLIDGTCYKMSEGLCSRFYHSTWCPPNNFNDGVPLTAVPGAHMRRPEPAAVPAA